MGMNQERSKQILAVIAIMIMIALIGHVVSVISFNQREHTVEGADETSATYMDLGNREDSTSSWLKRDFDLYGKTVDLSAQTIDGTLYNHFSEKISSWTMTIRIKNDCFINNTWCGTMEIHQFVGTEKEAVQTLDLRDYKLEDITLEYLHDGDLLIPLQKGDYLVYYPSVKDDEVPLDPNTELTMGMIFYYLEPLDLSDYQIDFYYHKEYTQGIGFYALIILVLIWIGVFVGQQVAKYTYKKAWKEMELRKTGISYMSDIYNIIYIVDLEKNELVSVLADEESEKQRPKNMGAREQLINLFRVDPTDPYVDLMMEFADINTLPDRLKKESIACNYISKNYGWCQVRFFAMDRKEDQNLKKVIFTIQVINDEIREMEKNEERITKTEEEKKSKNLFVDTMSRDVGAAADSILDYSGKIEEISQEEAVRNYAKKISYEGVQLQRVMGKILDATRLTAGLIEPENAEYSFGKMMQEVLDFAENEAEGTNVSIETNLPPSLPEKLYGDYTLMRKVLTELLLYVISKKNSGPIRLSVFEKASDGRVHLLFSVIDPENEYVTEGLTEKQFIESDRDLNLINELLELENSGLHVISTSGEGSEFYYEVDQSIEDTNA